MTRPVEVSVAEGQRLHIVHVANFYGPKSGGLRTSVQALGRGYRAAGHEFTVITPGERDAVSHTDFGTSIALAGPVVPGSGGYRMILRPAAVRRLLTRLRPDRLEVSDRTTLHGLGAWARTRRIPAVFFAHERVDGVLTAFGVPRALAVRLADRRNAATAKDFAAVVATTEFAGAEFARIGVAFADRPGAVWRVPLGVDLDRFRPDWSQLSDPGDPVRLLMCSRLSAEKAPHLAIEALAALRSGGVDAELTIAGDGPLRAALQDRAAGLPVSFRGFVTDRDELARLQQQADIAIAPGPIETFGLAALECLASGTAVVVNRSSALPEVLGDDPSAGRAAGPDGASFAAAIRELLETPADVRRLAARRRAEQFPWEATISRMLEVHRLLGNSRHVGRVSQQVAA